jgi:hypothetical protein
VFSVLLYTCLTWSPKKENGNKDKKKKERRARSEFSLSFSQLLQVCATKNPSPGISAEKTCRGLDERRLSSQIHLPSKASRFAHTVIAGHGASDCWYGKWSVSHKLPKSEANGSLSIYYSRSVPSSSEDSEKNLVGSDVPGSNVRSAEGLECFFPFAPG